MAAYKQISAKFWQNDFVLGLEPGERYFYMYLITNSMTTQCGIYKFNYRVAELETGYSAEEIEKYLKSFEEYEKILISKTSKEIMIVNWFKHNFRANKRTVQAINKELKEVKDKEFLQLLLSICNEKQLPIEDIFNGIALLDIEIEGEETAAEMLQETPSNQEVIPTEALEKEKEAAVEAKEVKFDGFSQTKAVAGAEQIFEEDLVPEEMVEEEQEAIAEGVAIASWVFDSA